MKTHPAHFSTETLLLLAEELCARAREALRVKEEFNEQTFEDNFQDMPLIFTALVNHLGRDHALVKQTGREMSAIMLLFFSPGDQR